MSSAVPVRLAYNARKRRVIYIQETAHSPKSPVPETGEEVAFELRADFIKKHKNELEKNSVRKRVGIVDDQIERILAELEKEEWYHGFLPLEDISGLLKEKGDFLIRALDPEADKPPMACVTVNWEEIRDHIIHFRVLGESRLFTLDGNFRNTSIIDLVKFHLGSGSPIADEVKLLRPIPKQKWELTKDKLTFGEKLGHGEFAEVFAGKLKEGSNKEIDVAIKKTKVSEDNKDEIEEMHKEARLMRQYKHRNIVAFFGIVYTGAESALIVMERIHGGSLDSYLKKNPDLTNDSKISYAADLAYGLLYLHNKKCLHRDVACRNCLIDEIQQRVKLSDFGMSKQGDVYHIAIGEKTPIRWQAPEVLKQRLYTAKADVFSYGITVWEIFHKAEMPYTNIENKVIKAKITDPTFRPEISADVPLAMVKVMKACWKGEADKRPTMLGIAKYLRNKIKRIAAERKFREMSERRTRSSRRQKTQKSERRRSTTNVLASLRRKKKKQEKSRQQQSQQQSKSTDTP